MTYEADARWSCALSINRSEANSCAWHPNYRFTFNNFHSIKLTPKNAPVSGVHWTVAEFLIYLLFKYYAWPGSAWCWLSAPAFIFSRVSWWHLHYWMCHSSVDILMHRIHIQSLGFNGPKIFIPADGQKKLRFNELFRDKNAHTTCGLAFRRSNECTARNKFQ